MTRPRTELWPHLIFGTAQLGLEYGIANTRGMPDERDARALLDAAWEAGITALDTARAYGAAETRIGQWLRGSGHRPRLISKFPAISDEGAIDPAASVRAAFAESRMALGVAAIDGYLAHRATDLARPGVGDALRALVAEGRIGKFGLSAYTSEDIDLALSIEDLSLIQAPVSALNRTLVTTGAIERCTAAGVTVFARSIFAQGAFFLDADTMPDHLVPAAPVLARFRTLAAEAEMTPAALALGAVRAMPGIGSIVIGVDHPGQLSEVVAAARAGLPEPGLLDAVRALADKIDPELLDPSRWPKQ